MVLAQALPFVHPAIAAVALAAGLIPVAIHLINRRRFHRVPWAAMSFLLAANRRSAKRLRLEQFLLLAARIGLIVLFGMAAARPFVPTADWIPSSSASVHRLILLDNSLSMSAKRSDGKTRFTVAKESALEILNGLPTADPVSLITLASPAARRIVQGSYDRRLAKEQISATEATLRSTDLTGGLQAALEILKESPAATGNRVVYLISDFPRSMWLGGPETETNSASYGEPSQATQLLRQVADALGPGSANLILVNAAERDAPNVAVTELGTGTRLVAPDLPVRLSVTVKNFSDTALRSATITFVQNGRTVRREPVPVVEPQGSTVVSTTLVLGETGGQAIEARLSTERANALVEDDTRNLSIDVRDSRQILLVDGRPGVSTLDGQAGFLGAALSPGTTLAQRTTRVPGVKTTRQLITTKTVVAAELAGEPLPDYDAVALCNVATLSPEDWTRLADFVRAGGGLLVFLGDAVNLDHYNRVGSASGKGLLPGKLERVVEAALQAAPSTASPDGPAYAFSRAPLTHPLVSEFEDRPASGLFLARVLKYVKTTFDPLRADAALRFDTGDPAIVVSRVGAGNVLLFTTSPNMDWNNLPAKGDFVSLMMNAVSFASAHHGADRNLLVGQSIKEPISALQSSRPAHVVSPQGTTLASFTNLGDAGLVLQSGPLEDAGFAIASIGPDVVQFAVNVDSQESDLTSLSREQFLAAAGVELRWVTPGEIAGLRASATHSAELGGFALYAATLLLLCELWLGMRFAEPHAGGVR